MSRLTNYTLSAGILGAQYWRTILAAIPTAIALIALSFWAASAALDHENPPPCYEFDCFEGDTTHE